MRKGILLFALLAALFWGARVDCALPPEFSVQKRTLSTLAQSSSWQLAGSPLPEGWEGGTLRLLLPLRRRFAGMRDAGLVRRMRCAAEEALETLWDSSIEAPRKILIAPFGGETPMAGPLQPLPAYDSALGAFFGLDAENWAKMAVQYDRSWMAAPWPASMVLVKSALYCQSDDGLLCALDLRTGKEIWSFFPPQLCRALRLKTALALASGELLPWLLAGGLTAEKVKGSETPEKIFLWGSLGQGGRGLYCLDVTDPEAPLFEWAREDWPDGEACVLWGKGESSVSRMGMVQAAPLVAYYGGNWNLIVPSGPDKAGKILVLDALTGKNLDSCDGQDAAQFSLRPCGLMDASGSLSRLIQCDSAGGIQFFSRESSSWSADGRVDLGGITEEPSLQFYFSPIPCATVQGLWMAFVAAAGKGAVIAAAPEAMEDLWWEQAPLNARYGAWWRFLEGFHPVMSALFYDGLLYVLGTEENQSVLKVFDLLSGRLAGSQVLDKAKALILHGGAVKGLTLDDTSGEYNLTALSVDLPMPSSGIYYTIER